MEPQAPLSQGPLSTSRPSCMSKVWRAAKAHANHSLLYSSNLLLSSWEPVGTDRHNSCVLCSCSSRHADTASGLSRAMCLAGAVCPHRCTCRLPRPHVLSSSGWTMQGCAAVVAQDLHPGDISSNDSTRWLSRLPQQCFSSGEPSHLSSAALRWIVWSQPGDFFFPLTS